MTDAIRDEPLESLGMLDHPNPTASLHTALEDDPVAPAAMSALAVSGVRPESDAGKIDGRLVTRLSDACLASDTDAPTLLVARMLDAGIGSVEIAELYVPAAARALGDRWCADEANFARVTVACSRLHGVLRDLSPLWRPTTPMDPNAPSVLVLVGEDVYHTLGATVLAGVMRRNGFCVKLWVGARPGQIADVLKKSEFQAVLISASSGESLDGVRHFVQAIRNALPVAPVVIVGGTITGCGTSGDVVAMTGADHVTNDPARAMVLCHQTTPSERACRSKLSASVRRS